MKSTQKINLFSIVLLSCLTFNGVHAQQDTSALQVRSKKMTENLTNKLQLTNAQQTNVEKWNEEFILKAKTIRQNDSISAELKEVMLQKVRDERIERVRTVLTPEQKKKLEEMIRNQEIRKDEDDERDDHGKGKHHDKDHSKKEHEHHDHKFMKQTEMMQKKLKLTKPQHAQVLQINKETDDKLESVRKDKSIKGEEKKKKVEEIKNLRITKIKALLSPEQLVKFNKMLEKKEDEHHHDKD